MSTSKPCTMSPKCESHGILCVKEFTCIPLSDCRCDIQQFNSRYFSLTNIQCYNTNLHCSSSVLFQPVEVGYLFLVTVRQPTEIPRQEGSPLLCYTRQQSGPDLRGTCGMSRFASRYL